MICIIPSKMNKSVTHAVFLNDSVWLCGFVLSISSSAAVGVERAVFGVLLTDPDLGGDPALPLALGCGLCVLPPVCCMISSPKEKKTQIFLSGEYAGSHRPCTLNISTNQFILVRQKKTVGLYLPIPVRTDIGLEYFESSQCRLLLVLAVLTGSRYRLQVQWEIHQLLRLF